MKHSATVRVAAGYRANKTRAMGAVGSGQGVVQCGPAGPVAKNVSVVTLPHLVISLLSLPLSFSDQSDLMPPDCQSVICSRHCGSYLK